MTTFLTEFNLEIFFEKSYFPGKPQYSAILIFFAIWHLIAFDELQHDYKNPVDQCNSLNPLVLPEYGCHALILVLMFSSNEISSAILNIPLLAYHIYRYSKRPVAMSKVISIFVKKQFINIKIEVSHQNQDQKQSF